MGLHFDFSAEQRMLGESVRGVLARESGASGTAELGRRLAAHGLFGAMAAPEAGGLGLGLTDALAIALETGRAQARFPVMETMAAARLLAGVRPAALAAVLEGRELATCASGEAELVTAAAGARLHGAVLAPYAKDARWLAVSVRRADRNEPGPWAALVDMRAADIDAVPAPDFDLTYPVFRIFLDVPVEPAAIVQTDLNRQLAVLACGELTGAAEHCFELTLRHLKERVQFGKPIGVNQALRHRAADDWVRVQGMRAAAEYAAAVFDAAQDSQPGTEFAFADFAAATHVAKACCSRAARIVAENAVQSHGGLAFTWEFGLHIPLRRILRLALAFGAASDHHDALAATLLHGNRRPA